MSAEEITRPAEIAAARTSGSDPSRGTRTARSALHGVRSNATAPIGSQCRPECVTPTPAQAHCSVCHRTFGGVSRFDAHRDNGHCVDPATLDMIETNGVWRTPMDEAALARLTASRGGDTA